MLLLLTDRLLKVIRNQINLFTIIILLMAFSASGQTIDSLKAEFNRSEGIEKSRILIQLSDLVVDTTPDSALGYSLQALKIAQKFNSVYHIGDAYRAKGWAEYRLRRVKSSEQSLLRALREFSKIDDSVKIATLYDNIGDLYTFSGRLDESISASKIALGIFARNGNEKMEALQYSSIGLLYWRKGQYLEALQYHYRALTIREKLNIPYSIAMSANNIGVIYWRIGDYEKALKFYSKSHSLREEIKDSVGVIVASNNIGLIYLKLKFYDRADSTFNTSLEQSFRLKYNFGKAYSNLCLSMYYNEIGKYDKAIETGKKSAEYYSNQGELNSVATALNYVGRAYAGKKDYEMAEQIYSEALDSAKKVNDLYSITDTYQNFANLNIVKQDYDEADRYLEMAWAISTKEKFVELQAEYYQLKTTLEKKRGNFEQALKNFERFTELNNSNQIKKLSGDVADWVVDYNSREKEKENIALRKANELQDLQMKQNRFFLYGMVGISIILLAAFVLVFRFYRFRNKTSKQLMDQKNELERLNRILESRNVELAESNLYKDRLLSIVAHDLKNPFQALLGYSEVLMDEYDSLTKQEVVEYSRAIYNSAKNLLSITQNLLNWSRIQFNQFNISRQDIQILDMFNNTILFQKEIAKQKEIEFEIELKDSFSLNTDPEMLETVLRNLTSNAIKYSYPGSKIVLTAKESNETAQIIVEDSGIGIPSEKLQFLFTNKNIISSPGTKNERGTGLGLTICKDFINSLGGKIEVESKEGVGTRFIIILPVATKELV